MTQATRRRRLASERRLLDVGDRPLVVTVRQSARARRLILRVATGSGDVTVTVPAGAALAEGFTLATRRSDWIRDRLDRLPPRIPFADGTTLPVLGSALNVRWQPGDRRSVARHEDDLVVSGPADGIAAAVERWLRAEAARAIAPLVADKARRLGVVAAGVGVRDTRSRWGSCSPTGTLSFCWRLVLAPADVLDYVVAHEVAHLRERGHGARFWSIVATLTACLDDGRAWLSRHGHTLLRYG
jgi:hypothetical protein